MEKPAPPDTGDDKKLHDLDLPFGKKDFDWVDWFYDHRAGVLATVIAYLLLGIAFVSAKIVINQRPAAAIYMDFEDADVRELLDEKERLEREIARRQADREEYYDNLRNAISDANAEDEGSTSQGAPSPFSEEAQAAQERMDANRRALEQSLQEVNDILNWREQNSAPDTSRARTSRVRGDVTVEYSLEGRVHTFLPIPAYQCMEGGRIVINVTVNRNGVVTSASRAREGSSDPCLLDMAVKAAERSRFDVSQTAPERQHGTITYIFKPQ